MAVTVNVPVRLPKLGVKGVVQVKGSVGVPSAAWACCCTSAMASLAAILVDASSDAMLRCSADAAIDVAKPARSATEATPRMIMAIRTSTSVSPRSEEPGSLVRCCHLVTMRLRRESARITATLRRRWPGSSHPAG